MGAIKKIQNLYKRISEQNAQDEQRVQYIKDKIGHQISQDEKLQEKAAFILEQLIHQTPNKK